jgi:MoaA/NifB/PqqE/SkfB family radical SAM enzyme
MVDLKMNQLFIQKPFSGGILLSYKCTCACRHCMYACSPEWKSDWIAESDAEKILNKLVGRIKASPQGPNRIGVSYGLHFTGGEPFLNFDLLVKLVQKAGELKIPSTFVETNCFWSVDDRTAKEKLICLKEAGIKGLLISVNPFILEKVPFERTERVIKIGKEVFGRNIIVYQEIFYELFKSLRITGTFSFPEFIQKAGNSLHYVEMIPMGRAVYELGYLYRKFPAKNFFGEFCVKELTRPWHIHVDNYGNYITGFCGGISLGDAKSLDFISQGINLEEYPVLGALVTDIKRLHEFGIREFAYEEREDGYVSKCHLCVDIRRHIAYKTDRFKELKPMEFYVHLEAAEKGKE